MSAAGRDRLDQGAATVRDHVRNDRACHPDVREQVHVDDPADLFRRAREIGTQVRDPRVRNGDVHRSECLARAIDQRLDGLGRRDVARHRESADPIGDPRGALRVDVCDDDTRTAGRERLRDRPADAVPPTGDHGCAPGELERRSRSRAQKRSPPATDGRGPVALERLHDRAPDGPAMHLVGAVDDPIRARVRVPVRERKRRA